MKSSLSFRSAISHEDLSRIGEKLHEARVHLNPMHIIDEKSVLISGLGLVAGLSSVTGTRSGDLRKLLTITSNNLAGCTAGGAGIAKYILGFLSGLTVDY